MKNMNFTLLLAGQGISQVGDKFHMIALSIWVLETTGSSAKMGAVLAASLIPSLVVGLFSGVAVDRYSRKAIIVGTDLIRGVLLSGFALLFFKGMMTFPMVLVMQVLLSVNAAFFDPAIPAVIPAIVPENELARANSQHQFINSFSMVFGAMAGGLAVAHIGFAPVFVINAVSFLASAAFESVIKIPVSRKKGRGASRPAADAGFIRALQSGYHYIFTRRSLVILLFMVGVIHFFVGSIEVIMPVMAQVMSGDSAATLGLFQGALGAGGVLLALLVSRIDISGHEERTLFGGVFVVGVLYAAAGALPAGSSGTQGFAAVLFCVGAAVMLAAVSFKTLLQKRSQDQYAGRVFAVAGSLGNGSIPAAMLLYGLLLENYDPKGLLLVSGLLLMGASVGSYMLYKERTDGGKTEPLARTGPRD